MTRQSSQQRREVILSAAIGLFRTKGFMNTSTRDLTEIMGISRSHIYHYFPNWQDLCLTALEEFMTSDLLEASNELNQVPPVDALVLFANWFLPQKIDSDWLLYADTWQASARSEPYRLLAKKINDDWNELIRKIIVRGCEDGIFIQVDAEQTARQLSAIINGYSDALAREPTGDPQQSLEDIYALMNLLLAPSSSSFTKARHKYQTNTKSSV